MNYNRLGAYITVLLFSGILLFAAGYAWLTHVTNNSYIIANASQLLSSEIPIAQMGELQNEAQMELFHLRAANLIKSLGLCLFCPAYLALLYFSNTYRNSALVLKLFLWVLAALLCFIGVRMVASGALLGLLAMFIAFLLTIPNKAIIRSRKSLIGYVCLIHVLLGLWIAFAVYNSTIHFGFPSRAMLRAMAPLLTAATAATLSPWTAYLKSTPTPMFSKWNFYYRWSSILILSLVYSAFAIASAVETT